MISLRLKLSTKSSFRIELPLDFFPLCGHFGFGGWS